jgi:hypothetical protein
MVVLALLVVAAALVRHHEFTETALLLSLAAASGLAGRWLARDLRAHPANFPEPRAAHGLRLSATRDPGTGAH